MTASDHLSGQQFLDLYHHTAPEIAAVIRSTGRMKTKDNTGRAYFTTDPDSEYAHAFGAAQVHARVPRHWVENGPNGEDAPALLNDEFPSGEQHYAVKISHLRKEHFV